MFQYNLQDLLLAQFTCDITGDVHTYTSACVDMSYIHLYGVYGLPYAISISYLLELLYHTRTSESPFRYTLDTVELKQLHDTVLLYPYGTEAFANISLCYAPCHQEYLMCNPASIRKSLGKLTWEFPSDISDNITTTQYLKGVDVSMSSPLTSKHLQR